MVDLPWQGADTDEAGSAADDGIDGEPVVTCQFQDGTVKVYDDVIVIDRSSRSTFEDKAIPMTEVRGVTYSKRLVISYLQIDQAGVDTDTASRLSTPVDENTLHLGRGKRSCARRARDAIQARLE